MTTSPASRTPGDSSAPTSACPVWPLTRLVRDESEGLGPNAHAVGEGEASRRRVLAVMADGERVVALQLLDQVQDLQPSDAQRRRERVGQAQVGSGHAGRRDAR